MKIDIHSGYNVYRKQSAGAEPAAFTAPEVPAAAKQDVVEFSHNRAVVDKSLVGMKAGVHNYLAAQADGERLESLRAAIKNGTYRVSTADLVDSILERVV